MKKRIIALLLSVTLAMGSVGTVSASAAEAGAGQTDETATQEEASAGLTDETAPEEEEEADAGLTDETASEETEEADAGQTDETAPEETEKAATGLTDSTAPSEEAAIAGTTEEPSVQIETHATSLTNNIVGDVIARWFNTANEEEWDEIREESLEKYPIDPHDLSYYGDSLRVRYTGDEDEEGPGYFVYREEYLIFSEEEGKKYTVTSSDDGAAAYVTPAIPAEQLDGRIGVIFLADDISNDNILVFGGSPEYEGDTLIVPLKKTEDITVNELFSDGRFIVDIDGESSSDGGNSDLSVSKEAKNAGIDVDFHKNVSGTNWSAEITRFKPKLSHVSTDIDAWKFKFDFALGLEFDLGYKIKVSGATGKRETVSIASVKIPINKVVNIDLDYNWQVQFFDDVKISNLEGTLATDLDVELGTKAGIKNYKTQIYVDDLELENEGDCNKDINFYLGSQLHMEGGLFEVTIHLIFKKIHLGPILSLDYDSDGGCYVTARLSKNEWDENTLGAEHSDWPQEIHTCAKIGEDGCLSLHVREVQSYEIYIKIDLFFKKWKPHLHSDGVKTVGERDYYNSLTLGTGMKAGKCPHHFHKVEALVKYAVDGEPLPGATVTTTDRIDLKDFEKDLVSNVTDSEGLTCVYLPVVQGAKYTLAANKAVEVDGTTMHLTGTGKMSEAINETDDQQVVIYVTDNDKVDFTVNVTWAIDRDYKDKPGSLDLEIQKRTSPTGEWEKVETKTITDDNKWSVNFKEDKYTLNGSQAHINEFRVIVPGSTEHNDDGEGFYTYTIPAYTEVGGAAEPSHQTKYYMESEVTRDNDSDTINVNITETAVTEVTLSKKWKLSDSSEKAESVYLALEQMPAYGWGYTAKEESVPTGWTLVKDPISGDGTTLNELVSDGTLTIQNLDNNTGGADWTIGKVSDENNWSVTYTVPKYRNGVKMQFKGSELDHDVIENLFQNEYKVNKILKVNTADEYTSYPQEAEMGLQDWQYSAEVLNTNDDEHTISGRVTWVYDRSSFTETELQSGIKQDVTIDVYDEYGGKAGSVKLEKNNFEESEDVWTWSLSGENINRDREAGYSIEETFGSDPNGWAWSERYSTGLDVTNYLVGKDEGSLSVKVIFEGAADQTELPVDISFKVFAGSNAYGSYTVSSENDYFYDEAHFPCNKGVISVQTQNIEGWIQEYKAPTVTQTTLGGHNVNKFAFVVVYRLQRNVILDVNVKLKNSEDQNMPSLEDVAFDVYRDRELVNSGTCHFDGNAESSHVKISTDKDGNPLKLLHEYGVKYDYTVVAKPIDGFTNYVTYKEGDIADNPAKIGATIYEEWVGADRVNVKGTVSWEGDEGREGDLRPGSVRISVINAKGELAKSIDVPVNGDGTFEVNKLPGTGAAGEYVIQESHVDGYTSVYSTPEYVDGTWILNVTNKLTGLFPFKVKKTMKGSYKTEDEKETFEFKIDNYEGAEHGNEGAVILEYDLKVTGEGEKTAELLIDEDGLYAFSLREVTGVNAACTYDSVKKILLVSRTSDENGTPQFQSWTGTVSDEEGEYSPFDEEGHDDYDDPATVDFIKMMEEKESDTVEFINIYGALRVTKKWDTDQANEDKPESINVVLQHLEGEETDDQGSTKQNWKTVQTYTLDANNNWCAVYAPENIDEIDPAQYRFREVDKNGKVLLDSGDSDYKTSTDSSGVFDIKTGDQDQAQSKEVQYKAVYAMNDEDRITTITNTKVKEYAVHIYWEADEDAACDNEDLKAQWVPGGVKVVLQKKATDSDTWTTVDQMILHEGNEWQGVFLVKTANDDYDGTYRICELSHTDSSIDGSEVVPSGGSSGTPSYIEIIGADSEDGDSDDGDDDDSEDGDDDGGFANAVYNLWLGNRVERSNYNVRYEIKNEDEDDGDEGDENHGNRLEANIYNDLEKVTLRAEKKWVIDLEQTDKPDSIEVAIQEKRGRKWETVAVVELNSDNGYAAEKAMPKTKVENGKTVNMEYRIREMKEETILNKLLNDWLENLSWLNQPSSAYQSVMHEIKTKASGYYNLLPSDLKESTESFSSLAKQLGFPVDMIPPAYVYTKFLGAMDFAAAGSRIVYDKGDNDRLGDLTEWNKVTYEVDAAYTEISGTTEDEHTTEYMAEYEKDGNTTRITNTAILEIDVVKRWLKFGADDDDLPDSVWLILMEKPDEDALENGKKIEGVDLAGLNSLGVDEIPVFAPLQGGMDPLTFLGQLAIGIDLNFIGGLDKSLKLAVAKVSANDDWRKHFVVKKYQLGIPMEYKGAELTSEIIRQVVKYFIKIDIPISYNPLQNYFSVPTKAYQSFSSIEGLVHGDLSEVIDKLKYITVDDVKSLNLGSILLYDYEKMANVINIKIKTDSSDEPEKISIEVTKTWNDNNNEAKKRPEKVTVRLKANGKDNGKTLELSESNNWKQTFEDLPKKDDDGKEIKYTVTEDAVENYTAEVKGYNITNTFTNNKTQVTVTKVWEDEGNIDKIRPDSVTVKLLADGKETDKTLELSESGNWTGSFTDLDINGTGASSDSGNSSSSGNASGNGDSSGSGDSTHKIAYTVKEETTDVITGTDGKGTYKSETTGDAEKGFTITNTHTPEKQIIKGQIKWVDENDQDGIRPETVKVVLKKEGSDEELGTAEVSSASEWKFLFAQQPKQDEQGNEIKYVVEEEKTEVLTGEDKAGTYSLDSGNAENSYTITNTHTPEKAGVVVRKIWEDNENSLGDRPKSVTIRLYADGEELSEQELKANDEGKWEWEKDDLPKYKNGKEIEYTITEDAVRHYSSEIDDDPNSSANRPETDTAGTDDADTNSNRHFFTVTNTHAPGTMQIGVRKKWDDRDDQDGIRPNSVTAMLYADGKDTGKTVILSEANKWSAAFTEVPVYRKTATDAVEIAYTVKEKKTDIITGKDAAGTYAMEIMGDQTKGFVLVNIHTPEKITISGRKTWVGDEDRARYRPENIIIRLKGDGNDILYRSVSAGNNWEWTFDELPKFKDGKEINYTIIEKSVHGYISELDGYNITNTYNGMKQIRVTKVWDDQNDQDGIRPAAVKVKLLADGKETGKILELTEDGDWTGSFTGLDIFKEDDEGNVSDDIRITYTVEEVKEGVITGTDAPGTYSSEVTGDDAEGFTVTNTHTPETINIEGKKTWNDNENENRPEGIVIRVKANGKEVRAMTVSEDDNWKWNFTDLPKYKDGEEIIYIVTEDTVKGYTTDVTDYDVDNTYNPEKTQITVSMVWDDDNDYDGIRPDAVAVRLLADGEFYEGNVVALNKGNNWFATFKNLDVLKDGKEIEYTVVVNNVDRLTGVDGKGTYATVTTGNATKGFTITNVHTPGLMRVDVKKVWEDSKDKDKLRPGSVTVKLLKNGKETGDTIELSESNDWEGSFTELEEKSLFGLITNNYTVEEVLTDVITGEDSKTTYAVSVSGDAENGFTIINSHTPVVEPEPVPPEPVPPGPPPGPDGKQYTITYKLNGGSYEGDTADIVEKYLEGTVISIHAKPEREGYKFLYWKGSEYQPGEKYMVHEDHVFTAQWEKNGTPDKPDKPDKPTNSPNNGDAEQPVVYSALFGMSLLLLILLLAVRRRERKG